MERGSHLPEGKGSLEPIPGLGGSTGAGVNGERLGSSGGGGRKEGLVTMTGVCGLDGGEQGGVLSSSLLGDRSLTSGDRGGWSGGWLVGLMPGTWGDLDINYSGWVGGIYHRFALSQDQQGVFGEEILY